MSRDLFEAFKHRVNVCSAEIFTGQLRRSLAEHFPALARRQLEVLAQRAFHVIWLCEDRGSMHEYLPAYTKWEADVIQALGPVNAEGFDSEDELLSALIVKTEAAYTAAVKVYETYRARFDSYVCILDPKTGEVRYMSDLPPEVDFPILTTTL